MTIKYVRFVRHAESIANAGRDSIISGDSTLTERGRHQAVLVSERLMKIRIDAIVSSTLLRATETAAHIAAKKETHFERHEVFVERKLPTQLLGMKRRDAEARRLYALWEESFLQNDKQVGDGENFNLLLERARSALSYIEHRPEERLVVVTHGYLMRMIASHIYFGIALTNQIFHSFETVTKTTNTGIFEFKWDRKNRRSWEVITWNDHAHLPESLALPS